MNAVNKKLDAVFANLGLMLPFTTGLRIFWSALLTIGALTALDAGAREVQYVYDDLARVTQVVYDSCTTVEYDYDASGNITATRTLIDNSADADCDNIPNGSDVCAATPAGSVIDAQGCTVEQACPCSGPLTGGSWANHDAYVTCVTDRADELLSAGTITAGDRTFIIADAAASNCGGGNSVPDLVNDPASTDACHEILVDVLDNDSDVEDGAGANLAITGVSGALFGAAVVVNDAGVDKILYTPATGLSGIETLIYTVQDSGGASADAEIVITVNSTGDGDGDNVMDSCDNCLVRQNTNQRDTNGDGIGNACDADLNNDCIVNAVDLGLFRSVFFTNDADSDYSGDGVVNTIDLGIMRLLFFAPPGPSGLDNACN